MKVTCAKCKTKDINLSKVFLDAGCYYCPICGADLTEKGNALPQKEQEALK